MENSLRGSELELKEVRADCKNWENLLKKAEKSKEKTKKKREQKVLHLLNRIVCLKDTLDNMKIEVIRNQTPGTGDLERLQLCQKNIKLILPEIRSTQYTEHDDSMIEEIGKVASSLVMQLANQQILINRFLMRALGVKLKPNRSGSLRGRSR